MFLKASDLLEKGIKFSSCSKVQFTVHQKNKAKLTVSLHIELTFRELWNQL